LLTVVDENGIPFDLIVSKDKDHEGNTLKALAEADDCVVCVEGKVRMPFDRGMNIGFSMWGVAGAEQSNPQMWNADERIAKYIVKQARNKAAARGR
jgi:hypothetical protein